MVGISNTERKLNRTYYDDMYVVVVVVYFYIICSYEHKWRGENGQKGNLYHISSSTKWCLVIMNNSFIQYNKIPQWSTETDTQYWWK